MAFNRRNTPNAVQESNTEREVRKSIGFVNLYIELEDGSRVKVAGDLKLRFYEENPTHKAYIDFCKEHNLNPLEAGEGITVEVVPYTTPDPDAPVARPKFFSKAD